MYQEVCFNRGTEAGGGGEVNVGQSHSPSSHFMLATGLMVVMHSAHNERKQETILKILLEN